MFSFFKKININKAIEDTHLVLLNNINIIKLSRNDELPKGFWKDDYIITYFATLSTLIFNSLTKGETTREERGEASKAIWDKLCPEESENITEIYRTFKSNNLNDDFKRGNTNAANVFGMLHGILKPELQNDPNIIRAKEMAPAFKANSLEMGIESDDRSSVSAALSQIYLVEYLNEKFGNN